MDSQRISRIFDLLGYLATHGPRTLSEIGRELDVPVSSAHDLVKALVDTEVLSAVGKRYQLGPRAFRLGLQISDSVGVRKVARRHLEALVDRIGFDVYLAGRTGLRVVYVDRYPGRQPVNIDIPLGRRLYLHSTAVGKLYAAFDTELRQTLLASPRPSLTGNTLTQPQQLDREFAAIRRDGISISREESVHGVVGIAAPVWDDGSNALTAAVHVSALRGQLAPDALPDIVAELRTAAHAIEQDLSPRAVAHIA